MSDLALSSRAALPRPDPYPERKGKRPDAVARAVVAAQSIVMPHLMRARRIRLRRIVAATARHDARDGCSHKENCEPGAGINPS